MEKIKSRLEFQVDKLREPFNAFVGAQATASGFLLAALVAAMLVANSPLSSYYEELQHLRLGLVFGEDTVAWSLLEVVNDGLIALFFFLIGLEVKRELLAGELQEKERIRILIAAALGGMVVPATAYVAVNAVFENGQIAAWAIPMATDTAIAIAILMALGSRVHKAVVAFLVGVAIIDDIGATLVIALFYTERLALPALSLATALLAALSFFNRAGLRHPVIYATLGVVVWIAIVRSGIHASIAGILVAATVPARPRIESGALKHRVDGAVAAVPSDAGAKDVLGEAHIHKQIAKVEQLAQDATTPLRRWEDALELPVALLVLPLFAFLNAGVSVNGSALANVFADPVGLGIVAGLVLGKPAGILAGVWLGERSGWAHRPEDLSNRGLLGVGLIAGVGFTMSTFIANLALGQAAESLETAKLAIIIASAIAATAGFCFLRIGSDSG